VTFVVDRDWRGVCDKLIRSPTSLFGRLSPPRSFDVYDSDGYVMYEMLKGRSKRASTGYSNLPRMTSSSAKLCCVLGVCRNLIMRDV
jgi:hypothetical protein